MPGMKMARSSLLVQVQLAGANHHQTYVISLPGQEYR